MTRLSIHDLDIVLDWGETIERRNKLDHEERQLLARLRWIGRQRDKARALDRLYAEGKLSQNDSDPHKAGR